MMSDYRRVTVILMYVRRRIHRISSSLFLRSLEFKVAGRPPVLFMIGFYSFVLHRIRIQATYLVQIYALYYRIVQSTLLNHLPSTSVIQQSNKHQDLLRNLTTLSSSFSASLLFQIYIDMPYQTSLDIPYLSTFTISLLSKNRRHRILPNLPYTNLNIACYSFGARHLLIGYISDSRLWSLVG